MDESTGATAPVANVSAAVEPAPANFAMPLDEFCARLSMTERSPELIAGFRHGELAAGRNHGTEAEYRGRFAAFLTAPA